MKRMVLDSLPTVPIRIPNDASFNASPRYQGRKLRGQPLLGQHQVKYTHFVPMMGDTSPNIKKLLEIPESNNSPMKPIEGYQEMLKDEKINKDEKGKVTPKTVFNPEFKNAARNYLDTPTIQRIDTFSPDPKSAKLVTKSTANLANIVAAAKPAAKPKSKPKPKTRPRSKTKQSHKMKKKKPEVKPKKISSFKIIRKK